MPKSRASRRFSGFALAIGLGLAGVSGCTAAPDPAETDDRPVVLTTFTVLADIARNVAGDHLRVESITKVGAEIHGYEPTPGTSPELRKRTWCSTTA